MSASACIGMHMTAYCCICESLDVYGLLMLYMYREIRSVCMPAVLQRNCIRSNVQHSQQLQIQFACCVVSNSITMVLLRLASECVCSNGRVHIPHGVCKHALSLVRSHIQCGRSAVGTICGPRFQLWVSTPTHAIYKRFVLAHVIYPT